MSADYTPTREAEKIALDALLAGREHDWWNRFYEDRAKPCPFFTTHPDESLVTWIRENHMPPGRALELGCGNGRNAVFLAQHGFSVDAVDYSQTAIDWARQRVQEAGVRVNVLHCSVFDLDPTPNTYDFVYDSGCFHHIAPHRRSQYVRLVSTALRPKAWFGMTCFRPEGGSGYSDEEVYEHRSLGGGLGYTEERLREIWSQGLVVHSIRQMEKCSAERGLFGESFLWSLRAQKHEASSVNKKESSCLDTSHSFAG
jgi:cyclopropane fatty-acyl-phospholipid synthase-like methyltransferase